MSNKKVIEVNKSDYYLVTICDEVGNRVFIKEADNAYFLSLLNTLLTDNKSVELAAYCLLSDQIKMLFHQLSDGGVAGFMHNIIKNYNQYYSKEYSIDDVLLESKYLIVKVLPEDILRVSGRIHANFDNWLNYQYSSLRAYLYNDTPDWLTRCHISNLYGSAVKYYDYLNTFDDK